VTGLAPLAVVIPLLGAALLAATWDLTQEPELLETATRAMRYSCERQLEDGSWYYGEGEGLRWIDSFHSGYNRNSLHRYIEATGDDRFSGHLERGLNFFAGHFVEPDGRVRYYHDSLYPIDIQAVAQTIDTLSLLGGRKAFCLDLAHRAAEWAIREFQDEDGHFYFRRSRFVSNKTPMLHWGQATMFKALSSLLNATAWETPAARAQGQTANLSPAEGNRAS